MFLKGAREGWPIVGSLVRLVVKDEFAERDRFMRANLDAMARRWVKCRRAWCSWSPWGNVCWAWQAWPLRTSRNRMRAAVPW